VGNHRLGEVHVWLDFKKSTHWLPVKLCRMIEKFMDKRPKPSLSARNPRIIPLECRNLIFVHRDSPF
jgi:hypothetical protein